MFYTYHNTPIGDILMAGDRHALKMMSFPQGHKQRHPNDTWQIKLSEFNEVTKQLDQYFCGSRTLFDLPLDPEGTDFQQSVWKGLLTIPYGETISYGELAKIIKNPKASRAVGTANGANPIPIIIPCHRVIGSTGKLTGFGGGLPTKQ